MLADCTPKATSGHRTTSLSPCQLLSPENKQSDCRLPVHWSVCQKRGPQWLSWAVGLDSLLEPWLRQAGC
jgi:hypothetical protein